MEELLKRVVANNPQNADALYKLGYINFAKMDYENVVRFIDYFMIIENFYSL